MPNIQTTLQNQPLPALEARMLLQAVTGLTRVGLISHGLDELTPEQLEQFQQLTQRRIDGEPMAYIIGQREFYGRDFIVTPDVLIPRPDTETLIDVVLKQYSTQRESPLSVLDLGTGSGAIAITIALECPAWRVSALDLSSSALKVAQKNATQLQAHIDFQLSDWLAVFDSTHTQFDLIISNPPYIDATDNHLKQGDVRFEPISALTDGADGLTNYRHLIDTVPNYLSSGGQLWFEHGYDQAKNVRELMHHKGFSHIQTFTDLGGNERVTGGTYLHS